MSADCKDETRRHIGRLSQAGGITPFLYADGRARGTSALRVKTATGLEFWVVPDRGMDIYEANFRGSSLCWHSPQGMVHPSYYSSRGLEWLKTFSGGLLTTCGLTMAGTPSIDDGEELGLHGPISTTPAEQLRWSERWEGTDCLFEIAGNMRESSVFGPNMLLERRITTSLKSSALEIEDVVSNEGVRVTPLMMLYHFNFGYPLLTASSQIYAPTKEVHPSDRFSEESVMRWSEFEPAVRDQQERVYFHDMAADKDGWVGIVLANDRDQPQFGIRLSYDASTLPQFAQWKLTGENHFVLGLEPSNCRTLGRKAERERGTLEMLAPGEKRRFRLRFEVLDDVSKLQRAIEELQKPQ